MESDIWLATNFGKGSQLKMPFQANSTPRNLLKVVIGIFIVMGCLFLTFGKKLNHLEIPLQSGVGIPVAYSGTGMWRTSGGTAFGDNGPNLYSHVDVPIEVAGVKAIAAGTLRSNNKYLNAPFSYQAKDFPLVMDRGNEFVIMALSKLTDNPIVNLNFFYLLTFILNFVLFAIGLLLWRGNLSYWDITLSVIFAFSPFHFIQGQFFIMNQAGLILSMAVVLKILGKQKVRPTSLIATACSTAVFGMYWAFFSVIFVSTVLIMSLKNIAIRINLMRLWLLMFITTAIAALIDYYPSLVYWHRYGATNITARTIAQNDSWPFRIIDLFLLPSYSILKISHLSRDVLASSAIPGEGSGLFAPLGIIVMVVSLLLVLASLKDGLQKKLSTLNSCDSSITSEQIIFLVMGMLSIPLIASVGGFGTILNHFGLSPIKSWERLAVVFEVLALSFSSVVLNYVKPFGLVQRMKNRRNTVNFKLSGNHIVRLIFVVAVPATLILSIPIGYDNHFSDAMKQFKSDQAFFKHIDQSVKDSSVFAFPVEYFPEGAEVCQSVPYASLFGYMHTKTIRWNAGAVVGRDLGWQAAVNAMSISEAANRLSDLDFSGMVFDKKGYSPKAWNSLMAQLELNSQSHVYVSQDTRWVFVELSDLFRQSIFVQHHGGFKRKYRTKESTLLLSASVQQLKASYTCSVLR
jgi:hypothetical protein